MWKFMYLSIVLQAKGNAMEYMTVMQAAKNGVYQREGSICFVPKVGLMVYSAWAIPKDPEKAKDARIKSGKYIRNRIRSKQRVGFYSDQDGFDKKKDRLIEDT